MFKVDSLRVTRLAHKLERVSRNFPRDAGRVLGTIRRRVPADASRAATAQYNIGRNRIAKGWRVSNVDMRRLSFTLTGPHKPISLIQFSARQTKRGVSAKVLRSGSRKLIRSGFIAKSPEGNVLVWTRDPDSAYRTATRGRHKGRLRQPIEHRFGPSQADMLNRPKVRQPIIKEFVVKSRAELLRLIKRGLAGRG